MTQNVYPTISPGWSVENRVTERRFIELGGSLGLPYHPGSISRSSIQLKSPLITELDLRRYKVPETSL
jgi:hypothetical protein